MNNLTKQKLIKRFSAFLNEGEDIQKGNLDNVYSKFVKRKAVFEEKAHKYPTPFYIFDKKLFNSHVLEFVNTFEKYIPNTKVFYAIKSNPHSFLLKSLHKMEIGLDCSSGIEIKHALKNSGQSLLFTGPAKMDNELHLVIDHPHRITLNIDSFSELQRIGELTNIHKKRIKAGVRIYTSIHGSWSKFGIPLEKLLDFFKLSQKYPFIDLQGIQVHISWNFDSEPYINIIEQIGHYLRSHFAKKMINKISYIDLGGGFFPEQTEGNHFSSTNVGAIHQVLFENKKITSKLENDHYFYRTVPIEKYARDIAKGLSENIYPLFKNKPNIYFEPGRIFSTYSMHILLRIRDIKEGRIIITDGGTNMIGWEKFEEDYCPVINLTHPSSKEIKCTIYGSLCTPSDIWGYFCYAKKMEVGDLLLIPNQGAYTFAFAQNFIKEFPKVYKC